MNDDKSCYLLSVLHANKYERFLNSQIELQNNTSYSKVSR